MGTLLAILFAGVLGFIAAGGGGRSAFDDPHDQFFRR
jgi:hypothetical protein